ncbi:MAG TPA: NAD(P)-dependent oxidoreductase [Gemmatimonadaceae bacterium]|nr:NAD(P)-dependent oxidoreductase [Gemmatimonadaceae bacterium]
MILITGGSGCVGRRLVEVLCAAGAQVTVLTRKASLELPAGAITVTCDLRSPGDFRTVLLGIETVVHLAALDARHASTPAEMESVNVGGTRLLARAAAFAGVRRFVHVSSAAVYGARRTALPFREDDAACPLDIYGSTKLAGERVLLEELQHSSVQWTILRPTGIYSARRSETAELFEEVRQRRIWFYGPTRVYLQPLYLEDLVGLIIKILDDARSYGEIVNVAGGDVVEHYQLVEAVAKAAGFARPMRVGIPSFVARPVAQLLRFVSDQWFATSQHARGSGIHSRCVDIAKARAIFDFQPTPLAEGLAATVAALRDRIDS